MRELRDRRLHEDEVRSVAVGCAEVWSGNGLEIAFARKRERGGPKEPPAHQVQEGDTIR